MDSVPLGLGERRQEPTSIGWELVNGREGVLWARSEEGSTPEQDDDFSEVDTLRDQSW